MDGVEAAGGLVTGGLIAKLLSRRENRRAESADHHSGVCSDCGAPVSGKYCSECGQPTHVHRSLLHLCEEVLHGVMHFDARIWRTLPLVMFNPGRLTREWVQGRRTRYVSPLALFLFTVFLMFFIMSFGGGAIEQSSLDERIADARTAVTELQASIPEAEAAAAGGEPGAAATLTGLQRGLAGARTRLESLEAARTAGPRADGLVPGSWQAEIADAARDGNVTIGVGDQKFQQKIIEKLGNPDFAFYKVQQTLYKFAFLLVPLSIPFVWLLFAWKRTFTWYDHGVFVLYSLTFMAILTMGMALIDALGGDRGDWRQATGSGLASLLVFAVPAHMFAQLKGAYSLGWFSALWRTFVLVLFCSFAATLFLVAVILLGLGA